MNTATATNQSSGRSGGVVCMRTFDSCECTQPIPPAENDNDGVRILVLGATGSIGRLVTEGAAAHGHDVTGVARQAAHAAAVPGVAFVAADVLDADAMARIVAGHDAVVYAVGAGVGRQTTLFSESTRALVGAMRMHGVRRLVAITGVGAGETRGHGGFLYDRIVFPLFTKRVYADKDRQEQIIRRSDLDWTIVRPASFKHTQPPGDLQVALDVTGVTLRAIARHEVAAFVIDALETSSYLRQAPFIGHA